MQRSGAAQFLFAPSTVGRDYELLPDNALKPLEPWREQLSIISNTDVRMAEAYSPGEVGGDHFRSSAVFLTQLTPKQTQGSDIECGISMDQLHAQRFGRKACCRRCSFASSQMTRAAAATTTIPARTQTVSVGPRQPSRCR